MEADGSDGTKISAPNDAKSPEAEIELNTTNDANAPKTMHIPSPTELPKTAPKPNSGLAPKPSSAPAPTRRVVRSIVASLKVPRTVPVPPESEFSAAPAANMKSVKGKKPLVRDLPITLATGYAITRRNLFAADYLKTHSPANGEFSRIWQELPAEQQKVCTQLFFDYHARQHSFQVWDSRARKLAKESKTGKLNNAGASSSNATATVDENDKENAATS
ncbi:hypothetical protein GYMLUDRAFT_100781 [Collybiopsis luxurians FD-317 M1]|uniref:Uncharacterized protein n=1 Tax=Collybiopsis luxurians FD-317 M1 TaxID=944289 RepID=A0A0D0CBP5_9AGAR|nr:hypothetical protein GYMLUDRAFT_100781 [Collybiopsis luxurians FD-317 M1]